MTIFKTIMIMLSFIMMVSCVKNPFSTRETETPYGAVGTWETPQSPEVAVRNLMFAYNEYIVSNYQLCFSDSFIYSSPEDSIDAVNDGRADLFANWDKAVELFVTNNVFSEFSADDSLNLLLTFSSTEEYSDLLDDSLSIIYRAYSLVVISNVTDLADTATYAGISKFHLSQEQLNWWTIFLWEDIPAISSQNDWGDFKARYR